MWRWSLFTGRERTAATWTGLPVPSAIRVVAEGKLRILAEAAEHGGLAWAADDLVVREGDLYVLLPYAYEHKPVPSWKCRVIALVGGMSAEIGKVKRLGYGRLDVSLDDFRRLPTASRKVERQLVHWLGGKAASAKGKAVRSDQQP